MRYDSIKTCYLCRVAVHAVYVCSHTIYSLYLQSNYYISQDTLYIYSVPCIYIYISLSQSI